METRNKNARRIAGLIMGIIMLFPVFVFGQETIELSDPEIASVAVTANQIDVNYAKIALEKNVSPEVKQFANSMIKDHSSVIDMAVDLATKLGVTPKDNALTRQLLAGEQEPKVNLKSLKGKDFEKAYVDNEVAYHEAVIGAVKDVLNPQTENKELKALLVKVMPVLEMHLEHAKQLQAKYK